MSASFLYFCVGLKAVGTREERQSLKWPPLNALVLSFLPYFPLPLLSNLKMEPSLWTPFWLAERLARSANPQFFFWTLLPPFSAHFQRQYMPRLALEPHYLGCQMYTKIHTIPPNLASIQLRDFFYPLPFYSNILLE
jgi:hypothetical protein